MNPNDKARRHFLQGAADGTGSYGERRRSA